MNSLKKGIVIISTPYHGYLKNLALAVTGKMDDHFTALWEGGHIKFWPEKMLRALLHETGFENIKFLRAGRIAQQEESPNRKNRPTCKKQDSNSAERLTYRRFIQMLQSSIGE